MSDVKYCDKCGAALVPESPPRYSRSTGEPVPEVCPTGRCDHYGGWDKHRWGKRGFFSVAKCLDCGVSEPWYD